MKKIVKLFLIFILLLSCKQKSKEVEVFNHNSFLDSALIYKSYIPKSSDIKISRTNYKEQLYGFGWVNVLQIGQV